MSYDIREVVPSTIRFSYHGESANELYGIFPDVPTFYMQGSNGDVSIEIKDIPFLIKALQLIDNADLMGVKSDD